MNQSGTSLATRRALEPGIPLPRRRSVGKSRRQELEVKLAELQKDYAELHTAIFEAAQVHRRLCAPRLVRYGDFEIASEIFAVRHLPGDFFTVEETDNGALLALGDICGKGLAAGMWTTHLVGLVATQAAATCEPESIVAGVNRDVCRMTSVPLASLFLARLDAISGRLDYCSAGHPPALLLRANGELESLSQGGLLLGVSGSVEFGRGDVLLAYSDGLIESVNENGEEFGVARLQEHLRQTHTASTDAMLFSLLGAVQDFAATRSLVDDMSLVIVGRGNR